MHFGSLRRIGSVAAVATAITLTSFDDAQAGVDIAVPHQGRRYHLLDLYGGFSPYGVGVAGGIRYGIPLIANGPIKSIDNAFYLSFGADVYFIDTTGNGRLRFGLGIPVMVHWQFNFTDHWSAFGELGVNVMLDDNFFENNVFAPNPLSWVGAAVGGNYYFNKDFGLVLRIGLPYLSFGVQWAL